MATTSRAAPEPSTGTYLSHARRSLRLDQRQVANALGVSARTVSRWENDWGLPPAERRPGLLSVLSDAPEHILGTLAARLGVARTVPASTAAPAVATAAPRDTPRGATPSLTPAALPEPAPADVATLRAALDDALYAAADELDVSPRRLRSVMIDVLRALDQLGLSATLARGLLARRHHAHSPARGKKADGLK